MICKARVTLTRLVLHASLSASVAFAAAAAHAQVTKTDKILAKVDLGINGEGIFNHSVSGPITDRYAPNAGATVSDAPSNTLGALVTLRYIQSPYAGVELNYSYARYTENYASTSGVSVGGVQTQANEISLGYVVMPAHTFFGFKPFASAGLGVTEFKPTPRGGQGLTRQGATTYYYSAGVQQEYFSDHFGLRAAFRQAFYLEPDFYQNYLTISRHTSTLEPYVGFYLRF